MKQECLPPPPIFNARTLLRARISALRLAALQEQELAAAVDRLRPAPDRERAERGKKRRARAEARSLPRMLAEVVEKARAGAYGPEVQARRLALDAERARCRDGAFRPSCRRTVRRA